MRGTCEEQRGVINVETPKVEPVAPMAPADPSPTQRMFSGESEVLNAILDELIACANDIEFRDAYDAVVIDFFDESRVWLNDCPTLIGALKNRIKEKENDIPD